MSTAKLPSGLRNPFLNYKMDVTSGLPPGDVPELHADILARSGDMLDHARGSGEGIGFLVVGEAGSGKSHLVAQLREQFEKLPNVVLACVKMKGAFAGRLWRHVREQFVKELMTEFRVQKHGTTAYQRVIRNRFPALAGGQLHSSHGLLGTILGKSAPKADLEALLAEFAGANDINYDLQKVLPKLDKDDLTGPAAAWLRGKQLGPADLGKLGLAPVYAGEQEQEVVAREVVLSLLALAGEATTVFLCFDEVEAIASSNFDAAVLRELANLITDVVTAAGPRVVATFIRPSTKIDLDRLAQVSNTQKMSLFSAGIPALDWEQVLRVVAARVDAEPTCQAYRRLHQSDVFWPLGRTFLEGLYDANKHAMTPRHAIRACAVEFERLKTGTPAQAPAAPGLPPPAAAPQPQAVTTSAAAPTAPPVAPLPPVAPPADDILKMWEKTRAKYLKAPQGVKFDATFGVALPWLVELTDLPFVRTQIAGNKHLGEFTMLLQPSPGPGLPTGISFCSQDPKALWRKQDRVLAAWDATRGKALASVAALRSAVEPNSKGVAERFDRLRTSGVRVVLIPADQLADLTAFQILFTAANTGDLTRAGKPVDAAEYSEWAKTHLTAPVRKFLIDVFGPLPQLGPVPATPVSPPAATTAKKVPVKV